MQPSCPAVEASGLVSPDFGLISSSRHNVYAEIQKDDIRLFRGYLDKTGALVGELRTFPVLSAELPVFQAVSYTWGDLVYTNSIDIAGEILPVLDSLYPFLRQVLAEDRQGLGSWWWIDSLCINQKDDHEKASQVSMMGTIFRAAQQTVVWLGEEADGSTQAFIFLHWMEKDFWKRGQDSEEWLARVAPRDGPYGKDWEAVEKLFSRPWWTRVWTVQEFIIPDRLVLFCGKSSMKRSVLRSSLIAIWHCHEKTLSYDNPWNRSRLLAWHIRFGKDKDTRLMAPSLIATMAYLGYHEATDPRDYIYSLSGIVKDFTLAGMPDYDQPVEKLYSKLVKSFVEHYHNLDIICFATLFKSDETETNDDLPSWVPDWRVRATAMVGPLMVSQSARGWIGNLRPIHSLDCTALYSASLNLEPQTYFSPDLSEMTCQGLILDSIDGLTGLPCLNLTNWQRQSDDPVQSTSDYFGPHRQLPLSLEQSSKLMESIVRCLTLNRRDHYFSHAIQMPKFSYIFQSLLTLAIASDPAVPSLIQAWYDANKSFHIRGWDLEALSGRWLEDFTGLTQEELVRTQDFHLFDARVHDVVVKMCKRLVVTDQGILGMAPRRSRKSDLICVLFGCSVPVVLRKCADAEKYTFIGECYVDGFMNGEALIRDRDMGKKTFRIV